MDLILVLLTNYGKSVLYFGSGFAIHSVFYSVPVVNLWFPSYRMDQVMIKFAHMGNVIDVFVEDVDKVMWIDLIIECEEGFRKNNYDFPKFPKFHYSYKMKDVNITSNSDLMSMLDRLKDREEITIWIGFGDKPSDCVIAARKLAETLKKNNPASPPKNLNSPEKEHFQINEGLNDLEQGWIVARKLAETLKKNNPASPPKNLNSLEKEHSQINEGLNDLEQESAVFPKPFPNVLHKIPKTTVARKKGSQNNNTVVEAMVVTESEFNEAFRNRHEREDQVVDDSARVEDQVVDDSNRVEDQVVDDTEQSAKVGKKIAKARDENAARKATKQSAEQSTSTSQPVGKTRFTRSSLKFASQLEPSIIKTQHSQKAYEGPSSQPVTRSKTNAKGKNKV
uniref:Uncharacterized protein n=1 Tax=Chenopodium quinoa TaxID=63459 RepID=A0A803M2S4_CHEQI